MGISWETGYSIFAVAASSWLIPVWYSTIPYVGDYMAGNPFLVLEFKEKRGLGYSYSWGLNDSPESGNFPNRKRCRKRAKLHHQTQLERSCTTSHVSSGRWAPPSSPSAKRAGLSPWIRKTCTRACAKQRYCDFFPEARVPASCTYGPKC